MPFAHKYTLAILLLLSCLLAGCATSSKVTQDYKTGTDFHAYKTFSWHNFSSDISPSDQLAIQHAVEQQLAQQGFKLVSELPDLILDLTIIKHAATPSSTGVGLSIGLPIGRHGAIGLGTNKLLGQNNQMAGLIILDITAKDTNQIVWRGSAEDVPINYFSLRNQAELNKILTSLVQQFPPK
jgi:predicted small secreted protein